MNILREWRGSAITEKAKLRRRNMNVPLGRLRKEWRVSPRDLNPYWMLISTKKSKARRRFEKSQKSSQRERKGKPLRASEATTVELSAPRKRSNFILTSEDQSTAPAVLVTLRRCLQRLVKERSINAAVLRILGSIPRPGTLHTNRLTRSERSWRPGEQRGPRQCRPRSECPTRRTGSFA
jgi:hypothetical protein